MLKGWLQEVISIRKNQTKVEWFENVINGEERCLAKPRGLRTAWRVMVDVKAE